MSRLAVMIAQLLKTAPMPNLMERVKSKAKDITGN